MGNRKESASRKRKRAVAASRRARAAAAFSHHSRKEGSQESSEQQRSAACTPSLEDSGTTIEDGTTVEYWDSFGIGEEPLPDLSIESSFASTQPEEPNISGRRIVSLSHFVDVVRSLDNHMCPKSTGRFVFVKEHRVGLWSELTFSCTECGEIKKLTTDPVPEPTSLTDKTILGINDAAVWAFMSIGSGHSQFEEAMSIIEVPAMSKGAFLRREESLGKCWKAVLLDQMIKAGKEEKTLAEEAGDFCKDGVTPHITVIVDGGWSHRSHGHRYSANSGVAVIIGKLTKKLLYLGVRNKLCSTCEHYARTGKEKKEHLCYKNWNESSGAMESDIIVEDFQRSVEMHGVEYRTFIGDGDSSVLHQILTKVEYGRFVKKRECANHVVKCYTTRLYAIAKETKGISAYLSGPRIKRIKNGARKAIKHYANILRDVQGTAEEKDAQKAELTLELAADLINGPKHVFGCHDKCKSYFCDGTKGDNVYENMPKVLQLKIVTAANIIAEKAGRLVTNDTSNLAEAVMSLVAKLSGGKQINRCQKGSYEHRCYGAGLSFQLGPHWHCATTKAVTCKSPAAILKRYANKKFCQKASKESLRRKLFEENGHLQRRRKESPMKDSRCHYGPNCQKPDMPLEQFSEKEANILKSLQVDKKRRIEIEEHTRGQADNCTWHVERQMRLTVSNFYAVCRRRESTPCDALVKSLLYKNSFTSAALEHGKQQEQVAVRLYEEETGTRVQPCGLFVDQEYGFLAASPDGLVGSDGILEVKCPFTAKEMEPCEAAKKFNQRSQILEPPALSNSHRYYYQVQGQLNITKRSFCHFVVYTSKGIHVQRIEREESFWKLKMLPFLIRFYRDCLLPEIVDPRITRSMPIRRPQWNERAIEAQRKIKEAATKSKLTKHSSLSDARRDLDS
ncbi:uncharacterized protein LOC142588576 [Dermacentor variabilis]|uniref:uncharacterized protein LOC142588576 n=1 Tax=Dermacentor variabilis TaxID=34621 RepID=UPI003F5C0B59